MPRPKHCLTASNPGPEIICVEDSDSNSSDSIIEVEKPPKPTPPIVELSEENELVLNVLQTIPVDVVKHPVYTEMAIEEMNPLNDSLSAYHWTPGMKMYYNADWGDEKTFSVSTLQSKMKKGPRLWEIAERDMFPSGSGKRCKKCGGSDHLVKRCPDRFRPKTCTMCGNQGHYSNNCPKTICLTCGQRKNSFVQACAICQKRLGSVTCRRCSLVGHSIIDCTDNWRRFHNITDWKGFRNASSNSLGDVEEPNGLKCGKVNKSWENLWCCNCGEKGHDAHYCRHKNESGFTRAFPFVVFYEKQVPSTIEELLDGPPQKKPHLQFDSHQPQVSPLVQNAHGSADFIKLTATDLPNTSTMNGQGQSRSPWEVTIQMKGNKRMRYFDGRSSYPLEAVDEMKGTQNFDGRSSYPSEVAHQMEGNNGMRYFDGRRSYPLDAVDQMKGTQNFNSRRSYPSEVAHQMEGNNGMRYFDGRRSYPMDAVNQMKGARYFNVNVASVNNLAKSNKTKKRKKKKKRNQSQMNNQRRNFKKD